MLFRYSRNAGFTPFPARYLGGSSPRRVRQPSGNGSRTKAPTFLFAASLADSPLRNSESQLSARLHTMSSQTGTLYRITSDKGSSSSHSTESDGSLTGMYRPRAVQHHSSCFHSSRSWSIGSTVRYRKPGRLVAQYSPFAGSMRNPGASSRNLLGWCVQSFMGVSLPGRPPDSN